MIMNVYAIKDNVSGSFMPPFLQLNNAVAFREFANIINHGDSIVSLNYKDMSLYQIGEYNMETGDLITSEGHPMLVTHGGPVKEFLNDEN